MNNAAQQWMIAACLLLAAGRASAHDAHAPAGGVLVGPVLVTRAEPVFPAEALRDGITGTVGLEILVGEEGVVESVKVVRAAGFGFDEAAVEAAKHMIFKPATQGGVAIDSTITFDQAFVIRPHYSAEAASEPASQAATAPSQTPVSLTQTHFETMVIASAPTSAASAMTIRNQDFELRPKTSPNDILRVVPGLLAVQHQGGGKADQLFLRGFDADHGTDVAVFVDGVPVNMPSHAHGQGFADLHWLIPEAIETIEVVKGPYEFKYGDFATAGAVNLVTRDRFAESSVAYTLGMLPTVKGRAVSAGRLVGIAAPQLSDSFSKLHTWAAFEVAYDEGPFQTQENLKRFNIFGKLTYDVTDTMKIGAFVQAYGSGWTGSGQIPQREVRANRMSQFGSEDPSEGGETERQMMTGFFHYKTEDQEVNATLYATRYRLSLWNDFTFFLRDPVNSDEIEQDDARTFTGGRLDYHFHRHAGDVLFSTTIGTEFRYDGVHVDRWADESQNGDSRKRVSRLIDTDDFALSGNNEDIDQLNVAAFFKEDIVFNKYFRLLGGVRADYFGFNVNDLSEKLGGGQPKTAGTAQFLPLSPKASAVISAIPGTLDLYLNFGEGFHSNQAPIALLDGKRELDADGRAFTVKAIPRFYGGEVGARAHLFNRVDLAAAVWGSYLENETVFDSDIAGFAPSSPTRRFGVDFEARVAILKWLYADFDLAQAAATNTSGGELALAPKIYMTGGLTVKHPSGWRGGVRFRYIGDRPAFDSDSPEYVYFTSKTLSTGQANPDYDPSRVTAQGYLIFDAYVSFRWRFLEASASIQNLFNSTWREAQFGNASCTRDETLNPANSNYAGSGNQLSNGAFVNRCGTAYANVGGVNQRSGVTDVHFTPGIPFNLQLTLKAYF